MIKTGIPKTGLEPQEAWTPIGASLDPTGHVMPSAVWV